MLSSVAFKNAWVNRLQMLYAVFTLFKKQTQNARLLIQLSAQYSYKLN